MCPYATGRSATFVVCGPPDRRSLLSQPTTHIHRLEIKILARSSGPRPANDISTEFEIRPNLKCYGVKRALLITTQFCTRHGRESAKFRDRLSLSWTTALQILIEFRNTISGTGAWRGLLSQCTRAHSKQLIKSEAVKPRDLKHCLHKPNCIVTTNPDRSVLITIITWHFQFHLVNVFSISNTNLSLSRVRVRLAEPLDPAWKIGK